MLLPAGIPILLRLHVTVSAVFYQGVGQGGDFGAEGELANQDLELSITREEMLARLPEQLVQEFEKEFVEVGDFGESISAAPPKQWGWADCIATLLCVKVTWMPSRCWWRQVLMLIRSANSAGRHCLRRRKTALTGLGNFCWRTVRIPILPMRVAGIRSI